MARCVSCGGCGRGHHRSDCSVHRIPHLLLVLRDHRLLPHRVDVDGISSANGNLATDHLKSNLSGFSRSAPAADQQSANALSAGSQSMGGIMSAPVAQAPPSQEQKDSALAENRAQGAEVQSQNQLLSQQAAGPRSLSEASQGNMPHSTSQTVEVTAPHPFFKLRTQLSRPASSISAELPRPKAPVLLCQASGSQHPPFQTGWRLSPWIQQAISSSARMPAKAGTGRTPVDGEAIRARLTSSSSRRNLFRERRYPLARQHLQS
jgi:hypothetical protein